MSKIAFALLLFLIPASWSLAAEQSAPEPSPMAKAVAAIKLKLTWKNIELQKDNPRSYSLRLNYKPVNQIGMRAMSMSDAEKDTKTIARTVLAHLLKEGRNPRDEYILIAVSAVQGGYKGETGTPKYVYFGTTSYSYTRDELEWKRSKQTGPTHMQRNPSVTIGWVMAQEAN